MDYVTYQSAEWTANTAYQYIKWSH